MGGVANISIHPFQSFQAAAGSCSSLCDSPHPQPIVHSFEDGTLDNLLDLIG